MRFLSGAASFLRRLIKGADYLDAPCVEQCNGLDCVDLGLSVMWATCNVGASCPEDYGDYYAWGETEQKQRYDEDNCDTWGKDVGDIGGTRRDVAHVKLGDGWRMPTMLELRELVDEDNCTWEWTTPHGHRGCKVRSKKTGNWIFLPAAGWHDGTALDGTGLAGNYWGTTPHESSTQGASNLGFDSGSWGTSWGGRCYGQPVRPVKSEPKSGSELVDIGLASGECNGHAYVDMGLSVKWATCNIGTFSPGEYGSYFAWGETEQKQHYSADNCETWEKDVGDIGSTIDDVAHVKWGGNWRMPTKAEFDELLDEDNCTWEWNTQDGHKGYEVKSKKTGNRIFLPAAGWYRGAEFINYAQRCWGSYWSSTPYENHIQDACSMGFGRDFRRTHWRYRGHGLTVRPVIEL